MSAYLVFSAEHLEANRLAGVQQAQDGKFEDDDKADYSYQTTDSGVLRLLVASKDKDDWRVLGEYSPAAWVQVGGQRYTQDTTHLGGFMGGKVDRREDPLRGGIQLPSV
jgi:hypothetical protein